MKQAFTAQQCSQIVAQILTHYNLGLAWSSVKVTTSQINTYRSELIAEVLSSARISEQHYQVYTGQSWHKYAHLVSIIVNKFKRSLSGHAIEQFQDEEQRLALFSALRSGLDEAINEVQALPLDGHLHPTSLGLPRWAGRSLPSAEVKVATQPKRRRRVMSTLVSVARTAAIAASSSEEGQEDAQSSTLKRSRSSSVPVPAVVVTNPAQQNGNVEASSLSGSDETQMQQVDLQQPVLVENQATGAVAMSSATTPAAERLNRLSRDVLVTQRVLTESINSEMRAMIITAVTLNVLYGIFCVYPYMPAMSFFAEGSSSDEPMFLLTAEPRFANESMPNATFTEATAESVAEGCSVIARFVQFMFGQALACLIFHCDCPPEIPMLNSVPEASGDSAESEPERADTAAPESTTAEFDIIPASFPLMQLAFVFLNNMVLLACLRYMADDAAVTSVSANEDDFDEDDTAGAGPAPMLG
jgi:hypothetical protein